MRPWQILQLLVPLSFWSLVVEQTNLYAKRHMELNPGGRKWVPVTLQEMMVWVGICLVMSMVVHSDYRMYWKKGRRGGVIF